MQDYASFYFSGDILNYPKLSYFLTNYTDNATEDNPNDPAQSRCNLKNLNHVPAQFVCSQKKRTKPGGLRKPNRGIRDLYRVDRPPGKLLANRRVQIG